MGPDYRFYLFILYCIFYALCPYHCPHAFIIHYYTSSTFTGRAAFLFCPDVALRLALRLVLKPASGATVFAGELVSISGLDTHSGALCHCVASSGVGFGSAGISYSLVDSGNVFVLIFICGSGDGCGLFILIVTIFAPLLSVSKIVT